MVPKKASRGLPEPRLVQGDLQSLPFDDQSFDSLVMTLVLCSVNDPRAGIKELYRVLKPGGRLFFLEHIHSAHEPFHSLQSWATPLWRRVAGNCHLDRPTVDYLRAEGFELEQLDYRLGKIISYGIGVKN